MKIISLSSSIAGPACAIATAIKKHFYNNDYQTNIFDYLEISLESINQFLLLEEKKKKMCKLKVRVKRSSQQIII